MSEVATVELQTKSPIYDVSATGLWSESFVQRSDHPQPLFLARLGQLGQVAALSLFLMASPATAMPDVWFFERRRKDIATTYWVVEGVVGKPISRAEALRIAQRVLERAERERLELAELEATRGIQWELET